MLIFFPLSGFMIGGFKSDNDVIQGAEHHDWQLRPRWLHFLFPLLEPNDMTITRRWRPYQDVFIPLRGSGGAAAIFVEGEARGSEAETCAQSADMFIYRFSEWPL